MQFVSAADFCFYEEFSQGYAVKMESQAGQSEPVAQVAIAGTHRANLSPQIQEAQRQVEEVVQVMRKNIENIEQRERNLQELSLRAESLERQSAEFTVTSRQLERKMWWQNLKWTWVAIGVTATVVTIVVVSLVVHFT